MPANPLIAHFQALGHYNQIVNKRIFDTCAELDAEEYRRERFASFGSIHRTLNHLLVGDRIWMSRFAGVEPESYRLNKILFEDFTGLHRAREAEDERILKLTQSLDDAFLRREIRYVNNQGNIHSDPVPLLLAHFFNHQTHHRAQVQAMLGQLGKPPNLDLHRALRPNPVGG